MVAKVAQRELQPQRVERLRFQQKVAKTRVERAVCGKQGFRRGIADQQAATLNVGR